MRAHNNGPLPSRSCLRRKNTGGGDTEGRIPQRKFPVGDPGGVSKSNSPVATYVVSTLKQQDHGFADDLAGGFRGQGTTSVCIALCCC